MTAAGGSPKIMGIDDVVRARTAAAAQGRSVVHCHGCFDIVHPGHVRHLQHARSLGDVLLVSVTADHHVNKGDGRPFFDQRLRAENLAAMSCVDFVCVNGEATAQELLDRVRPDIYVKGREYEQNNDPRFAAERETVERHGGRVVFSSGDVVFSSSALVDAMHAGVGGVEDFEDAGSARLRRLTVGHHLTPAVLGARLDRIVGMRLVVVGESLLDTYVQCAWPEVAGESPVLSLRPVEEVSFDGGAAILARHAAALGARPTLITTLPRTVQGEAMAERLRAEGVEVIAERVSGEMPEKQRLLVGREKLVKLDLTQPMVIDSAAQRRIVAAAAEAADGADAAIVADFGLGMLGPRLVGDLFGVLRRGARVLGGDVSGSRSTLLAMHDADWLSPSERELRGVLGNPDTSLPAIAWTLAERTGARRVVVTMGPEGVVVFDRVADAGSLDGFASRLSSEHIPALTRHAIDPLGCGDAMLTTGVLALAAGADSVGAGYLGSAAAAVQAERIGNHTVSRRSIMERVRRLAEAPPIVQTLSQATMRASG